MYFKSEVRNLPFSRSFPIHQILLHFYNIQSGGPHRHNRFY